MSTNDTKDLDAAGEVLSAMGLQRLARLHMDVALLAQLARTRQADVPLEDAAELRLGEMVRSLAWLEACMGQVLDERRATATREKDAAASGADAAESVDAAAPDATEPETDEAAATYVSGVTLGQIDEIHLLLDNLRALGNVVTCADHAELADTTLSVMGDAIYRDVGTLRELIDAVNAQRLAPPGTRPGVREEEATYLARPARLPMSGASHFVRPHPTYQ